ncbi:hypothetical protein SDJN02_22781, partial [Cucurbita argyrosperma subsp. argyrosperma]
MAKCEKLPFTMSLHPAEVEPKQKLALKKVDFDFEFLAADVSSFFMSNSLKEKSSHLGNVAPNAELNSAFNCLTLEK